MTGVTVGQTVVVIGGSSGIGLETARLARVNGAEVILTARSPARLKLAADVDASRRSRKGFRTEGLAARAAATPSVALFVSSSQT